MVSGTTTSRKEETMMKGVFSLVVSGAFLCLLTNTALAYESEPPQAPGPDRSLLSTWDKPAFSPVPHSEGPRLGSRPAKGVHVDFLLSPDFQKLGPMLARTNSEVATQAN
jgi:hypothetical protein